MGARAVLRKLRAPLERRSYRLAKVLHQRTLRYRRAKYDKAPLLLLTMGKVGTKSLHASLDSAKIGRCIYETHHVSRKMIDVLERDAIKRFHADIRPAQYVWKCRYLRKHFLDEAEHDRWKVVTVVRDPVSRNVSNFFQNLEMTSLSDGSYRVFSQWNGYDVIVRKKNIDELICLFFEKFNHHIHEHYFDRNFRDVIGIDLFAESFPKDIGYKIYHPAKADVLLLKLERLTDTAPVAFRAFIGLEEFRLQNFNLTSQKNFAELYSWFKTSIRFPDTYLDEMYASAYVQHFYTTVEIDNFRKRWT